MADFDDDTRDYTRSDQALLARLERENERKKAKAEAASKAMARTIAAGLKDANTKQAIARELLELNDEDGERSRKLAKYIHVHGQGKGVSEFEANQGRYWEDDGSQDDDF